MSDSPTPETDSVTRSSDETPWTPWLCAGHAKRLERERDDALKEWDLAIDGWGKALEERDEARRELDEAMDALKWIAGRYCHEKTTFQLAQEAYEMSSKARWTIQKIEQKEEAK